MCLAQVRVSLLLTTPFLNFAFEIDDVAATSQQRRYFADGPAASKLGMYVHTAGLFVEACVALFMIWVGFRSERPWAAWELARGKMLWAPWSISGSERPEWNPSKALAQEMQGLHGISGHQNTERNLFGALGPKIHGAHGSHGTWMPSHPWAPWISWGPGA